MNYLKHGLGNSDRFAEAQEMARPLTGRGDRSRASYGSLLSSVQTLDGLCKKDRKCVLRDGHTKPCWPHE